jgi:hypothetical protein
MLDALLGRKDGSRLVRKAGEAARAKFRESRDYWDAMMPADAEVAAAIFGGTLDKADQAPTIIETLADGYRQARSSVIEDARSWDSVVKQIVILATLADALDRKVLADRLGKLASCLQPGVAVPHSAEPSSLPAGLPSTAAPD